MLMDPKVHHLTMLATNPNVQQVVKEGMKHVGKLGDHVGNLGDHVGKIGEHVEKFSEHAEKIGEGIKHAEKIGQ